ncbi:1-deoxy-D-xylulose-5-phosphate reductoisomerase [bacterium]|nr:1-deoxy-D-xylulose-5-phosphate reductoisomerase [bacterium]
MKRLAILGSTGVVGRKTLEVAAAFEQELEVVALACKERTDILQGQIAKFHPKLVYVADKERAKDVGAKATLLEIVQDEEVDIVVFAMDGVGALEVAFLAASSKKDIALANKEILVCAGEAFVEHCKKQGVSILPIDSEHCALEEALLGEDQSKVEKLVLTASGGPFFQKEMEQTVEAAVMHPTYACGPKVAINCATMMNKGMELIEAQHLFGVDPSMLDVVIHPESVVQSMVSFVDGTTKAIIARPDLTRSIQYALLGRRERSQRKKLDLTELSSLHFFPKQKKFRHLELAIAAMGEGGSAPSFLNAANEVLVERFYHREVSFTGIGEILEELMSKAAISKENSLEAVLFADKEARALASTYTPR